MSDGKIIGVGHDITLKVKVGPTVLPAQYGDDFATHPDYRGIGVYNEITKRINQVQENIAQFSFWLSNNPIVIDGVRKLEKQGRFQFPYSLRHLFRVKDVALHVKKKSMNNPALVQPTFSAIKTWNRVINGLAAKKVENNADFRMVQSPIFDDRANTLWEKVKDNYNYIIVKEQDYLNWRYCDSRGGNYLLREAKNGDETLGFVVLEVRDEAGYAEGYIVDLLTTPERPDIAYALFKDSCNYFDSLGLNAAHFQVVEGHPLQELASTVGFIELPGTSKYYIGCNIADGYSKERRILESSRPSQLQFNYGDYY